MEEQESSAPNFIPKDLLDIICILERDERHHSYKIVRNRTGFSLIAKFGAKNVESTSLKNNASVQQTASHQDKKQLSSEDKLRNKRRKRGRKYSSSRVSGITFASQHTDKNLKKHQNSSDANTVEQPKPKKKKTPAQVARDCARQKAYWKNVKVAKKLRAENLAAHNKLQETEAVPSSQVSVPAISQPENSGCLEVTALVSESNSCVTIEKGTDKTAQAQSDLHELSAEVAESEKSSILLDTSDELEFRKHLLNQLSEPDSDEDSPSVCGNCMKEREELRRCLGCKFVRYCSKECQASDWPSHKHLCHSIQTLPSLRDFAGST